MHGAQGLPARVAEFMGRHAMSRNGARLLAAVSGGADSVCLLHVLRDLGFEAEVAHFDHQTRDGESAGDAAFVRDMAAHMGLPFHLESRPIEIERKNSGRSFEEYARAARYEFLSRVAATRGCEAIATGHHADDNTETVLMRLIRGTTPGGAAGIPAVGEWGGVRVIRPLLCGTRRQIVEYLADRGLEYREDKTNADPRYFRNRVRRELLPLLVDGYNPRVREALLRFAEVQRNENQLMDQLAQAAFVRCVTDNGAVDRAAFRIEPSALQGRIIARLARKYGAADMPCDRIMAAARFIAAGATGAQFDLGADARLQNGRAQTVPTIVAPAKETDEVALAVPGVTAAFGEVFRVSMLEDRPAADLAGYCNARRQVFDADQAGSDLAARRRRDGDSFMPLGMTGTKKLQDYFVDACVPAYERDARIILTGSGRILWIVGAAMSAYAAVTKATKRYIEVDLIDGTEDTATLDGGRDPGEG